MDTFREQMCAAIPRATAALSLSLIVVAILVRVLKPPSPRWQRLAWLLVLLQGIVFLRFSLAIPCLPSEPVISANRPQMPAPPTTSPPRTFSPPASVRSPVPLPTEASAEATDWRRVAFNAWLVGCGLVLGWWCVLYFFVLRESARAAGAPTVWTNEWTALLSEMGLRNRIPLQVTQNVGPVLCRGLRGYRVLVPHALWESLTAEERSAVLRHELAHFRRADPWQSLLIRLLALPHWFNPLAWFVVRKLDECAEWLCDDAATRSDNHSAEIFAQVLLRFGAEKPTQWIRMPGAAMRGGRLHGRIRRLLKPASRKRTTVKGLALATAACGLLAAHMVRLDLVAAEQADGNKSTKTGNAASTKPAVVKQSTLERILANWKARQQRVRTVHVVWDARDSDRRDRRETWIEETGRFRTDWLEHRLKPPKPTNRWKDKLTSTIVDGTKHSRWESPVKDGDPPLALISDFERSGRWYEAIPNAASLSFYSLDPSPTHWKAGKLRLVTDNASIEGDRSRSAQLERSAVAGNEKFRETFWVDPKRDDIVVRWELRFEGGGGAERRLSIQYREDPKYGWIPARWRYRYGDNKIEAPEPIVSRFGINEVFPADTFATKFVAGTMVFDDIARERYVVGADGGKTDVIRLKSGEAPIAQVLEMRVDFPIDPQPLKDALQFVAEHYGIQILLDATAFEAAGIDPNSEVTVDTPGINVRELLKAMLKRWPPARFDIHDGVLKVTASKPRN